MESTSPTQPQVVLIAEDDPGSLMALATCLELAGYAVVPATDGETALACYDERGGRIDFVITDFHLPDCNGVEVIAELRWQGSTVPMLIITAAPVDAAVLVQQGASAVLQKPLNIEAVLAWLRPGQSEQGPHS
jgi:two-component system, OmpR family, alkaline phosphatase synthesis response regulator PhoP